MFRKSFLLIILFLTDIVLFGAIVRFLPLPNSIDLQCKLLSFVLAHWFLLGFWLSFGGTKAPWRQAIASGLFVVICAVAAPLDGVPNMAAVRGLLVLAITWSFYALMFFPRRLLGLRIGWSERDSVTKAKSQFGLGVLLAFMAVVSIPLAFGRLAFAMDSKLAWRALFEISLFYTPTCVIMLPFGIAIFATQNRLRKLSFSLVWVVAATFATKHFHPPTAGGQIMWESVEAIVGLVVLQVVVILVIARLMGLHWLGTAATEASSPSQPPATWRKNLEVATVQLFIITLAIGAGLLIFLANDVLQFTVVFVLAIAAPFLIVGQRLWRRAPLGLFWTAFIVAAAIPWLYAMYIGAQEAGTLLFGVPTFALTDPVVPVPSSGHDWPEVMVILFSPLIIGAIAGAAALTLPPAWSWLRKKLSPPAAKKLPAT